MAISVIAVAIRVIALVGVVAFCVSIGVITLVVFRVIAVVGVRVISLLGIVVVGVGVVAVV